MAEPLAVRGALAIAAAAAGDGLPAYVTPEQAHAIIDAAESMRDRLLLRCLWQTGGRISEVLRLRPCDVDQLEGALRLHNLKQKRRPLRLKAVYVSRTLVAELRAYAHDGRVSWQGYYFRSRESGPQPMHRAQAYRIVHAASVRAGVLVLGDRGPRPAHPRDFRHGAAVYPIRQRVPVTEVQQQLGHARLDSTAVYTRLANAERRAIADRVDW